MSFDGRNLFARSKMKPTSMSTTILSIKSYFAILEIYRVQQMEIEIQGIYQIVNEESKSTILTLDSIHNNNHCKFISSRIWGDEAWLRLWSEQFVLCKVADSLRENYKKEGRNQAMNEKYLIEKLGCGMPGSKWRPPDYETDALTNWANPATRIRVDGRFPAFSILICEIV